MDCTHNRVILLPLQTLTFKIQHDTLQLFKTVIRLYCSEFSDHNTISLVRCTVRTFLIRGRLLERYRTLDSDWSEGVE